MTVSDIGIELAELESIQTGETFAGVHYHTELLNRDGVTCYLFPTEQQGDREVAAAKQAARDARDVVQFRVIRIRKTDLPPAGQASATARKCTGDGAVKTAKLKGDALIKRLADIFRQAEEAALAADPGDDGGTCNLDTPAFTIERVRAATINKAAAMAGVQCTDFRWWSGRWFWLHVTLLGQGNRRATMSTAAQRVLDAVDDIPGWHACQYCQMD